MVRSLERAMIPQFLVLFSCVISVTSQTCTVLVTFNAGLTRSVPAYDIRKLLVAKALLSNNADVFCLQEYWQDDDVQKLLSQVSSVYPYHFSALHSNVGEIPSSQAQGAACSAGDLKFFSEHIIPCAAVHGCLVELQPSAADALACLAEHCQDMLKNDTFNGDCISCIAATASATSMIMSDCTASRERSGRLNGPGLVLLSKRPLLNASYHRFFPGRKMLLQRGYLTANHIDQGEIICTHLSATTGPYFEYDLDFGNYTAQLQAETRDLLDKYGQSSHILLGDLNTGPKVSSSNREKNLYPDQTSVFASLISHGYQAPYTSMDGRCTYCESNILVDGYNEAIDHVLLKGHRSSVVSSQRVLDQTDLSDHYGVQSALHSPGRPVHFL